MKILVIICLTILISNVMGQDNIVDSVIMEGVFERRRGACHLSGDGKTRRIPINWFFILTESSREKYGIGVIELGPFIKKSLHVKEKVNIFVKLTQKQIDLLRSDTVPNSNFPLFIDDNNISVIIESDTLDN